MFDYLGFRRKLWLVERARRQTNESYDKDMKAARERGDSPSKVEELNEAARFEDQTYGDEIYRMHTSYLYQEANRLIVPVPPHTDPEHWEEEFGIYRLTPKGVNELRSAIRLEKKLRREAVLMWVPALTALTGLAGAGIGLLFAFFGVTLPK